MYLFHSEKHHFIQGSIYSLYVLGFVIMVYLFILMIKYDPFLYINLTPLCDNSDSSQILVTFWIIEVAFGSIYFLALELIFDLRNVS
jgi:hypothetical protein